MGYRLAGYDVIGGVEIDSEMMNLYRVNHQPDERLSFQLPIQDFVRMPVDNLVNSYPELFNLDILDGSPPCSSFSMAGAREEGWNEKKMFREGQTEQVLDDLFFHFIKVAELLRPRVVIAENVKGLIQGKARGYVKDILEAYDRAGYRTQLFLLNASKMGVPQARERTFFISTRKDLYLPKAHFQFNEKLISVEEAFKGIDPVGELINGPKTLSDWTRTMPGNGFGTVGGFNSHKKLSPHQVSFTQTATLRHYHWEHPNQISDEAVIRLQSFPEDYDFQDQDVGYVCGMSVPPLMMQRVALEVGEQLLKRTSS